jgi:ribosomal protein S18 acetylase RimI-like enzyme
MIEICPLKQLDAAELNRVTGPFTCREMYRVRYEDSAERTSFSLERVSLPEPHVHNYSHIDEAWVRDTLANADFSFGAYEDGLLVGALIAEKRAWNDSLWVWEFHVEAPRRGQGIGRQLMQHAADKARQAGLRTIICETQNRNACAISAYRKLGFRVEGVDISYYTNEDYPDKDVAVFMKLRL